MPQFLISRKAEQALINVEKQGFLMIDGLSKALKKESIDCLNETTFLELMNAGALVPNSDGFFPGIYQTYRANWRAVKGGRPDD